MLTQEKKKYLLDEEVSLYEALAVIEANDHRSAIVVSPEGRVLGTISDGDVRKAILDGRLVQTPVKMIMNTNYIFLRPTELSRAAELFASTHIFLIPVVDEHSRLVDVIEAY